MTFKSFTPRNHHGIRINKGFTDVQPFNVSDTTWRLPKVTRSSEGRAKAVASELSGVRGELPAFGRLPKSRSRARRVSGSSVSTQMCVFGHDTTRPAQNPP